MAKGNTKFEPSEFLLWIQSIPQEQRDVIADMIDSLDMKVPTDVARAAMRIMGHVARGKITPAIAQSLRDYLELSFQAVTFELSLRKQEKQAPNQFLLLLQQNVNPTEAPQLENKGEPVNAELTTKINNASKLLNYVEPPIADSKPHKIIEGQ